MELRNIFAKPIDRVIEGVIKADDESHLLNELEEYVLTDEIAKQLETYLEAYNNYQGDNGVWISGFYGSGKSHLLKMLAYVMENRTIEGRNAAEVFLPKIPDHNPLLKGALQKAVSRPSKSILFNIDQRADIISKQDRDALLAVFVKVFDEMCGYYGRQPYIAQFERNLDERGELQAFREAYSRIAGKPWELGREQVVLESGSVSKAFAEVSSQDLEHTAGILNKYREQYRLSISDFAEQVKKWLDRQPAGFRLNFFVDEVGQYIANNVNLMTNLQTLAESLSTVCKGQAWIVVTAQEDMQSILGDMMQQQTYDFTKIQARFAYRLRLTSADVAEVIQRRLLEKNEAGRELLTSMYARHHNNFQTLFSFADNGRVYQDFQNEEHFRFSYPFIPYQYTVFQSAIRGLSTHNAFEGRASSVGERSMLGVFQDVVVSIKEEPVGRLATFDRMFEGIRTSLKSGIQSAINTAERHLQEPYAVRVLKALFLVKYVKEFKATARNLSVLMLENFTEDVPALRRRIEKALNLLEEQTYIERRGDEYAFLTDEEKDIEEEIKSTTIEAHDVQQTLQELLFGRVMGGQSKLRYRDGHDYAFTRMLDGHMFSREQELSIHIVTSLSDGFEDLDEQRRLNMVKGGELRAVLPADPRFTADLALFKKTEKYIRQNSGVAHGNARRIIEAKGLQNTERQSELVARARELLAEATLLVAGSEVNAVGSDARSRISKGFEQLINVTYPNLRMLGGVQYSEADIRTSLAAAKEGAFGSELMQLTEPQQQLLNHIQRNAASALSVNLKGLITTFEHRPYGWPLPAILTNVAQLFSSGKIELHHQGNVLTPDTVERHLVNATSQESMLLMPQVEFTASQLRAVKELFTDFFGRPLAANEARGIAAELKEALRTLAAKLEGRLTAVSEYPFLEQLRSAAETLRQISSKENKWYFQELPNQTDTLLDLHEDVIQPIERFMEGPQKAIYDEARRLLTEEANNLQYLTEPGIEEIRQAVGAARPWQGGALQGLKPRIDELRQDLENLIVRTRTDALEQLDRREKLLRQTPEFTELTEGQRTEILAEFGRFRESIGCQEQIAMINDQLSRFENEHYPRLLEMLQPPAVTQAGQESGEAHAAETEAAESVPAHPTAAPPQRVVIPARQIHVSFDGIWIETEQQLDDYLANQRKAWLEHIQAGKRVQV